MIVTGNRNSSFASVLLFLSNIIYIFLSQFCIKDVYLRCTSLLQTLNYHLKCCPKICIISAISHYCHVNVVSATIPEIFFARFPNR